MSELMIIRVINDEDSNGPTHVTTIRIDVQVDGRGLPGPTP